MIFRVCEFVKIHEILILLCRYSCYVGQYSSTGNQLRTVKTCNQHRSICDIHTPGGCVETIKDSFSHVTTPFLFLHVPSICTCRKTE